MFRGFFIRVSEMAEEVKWPDPKRLTKPDQSSSPVWTHFRCELLSEPSHAPDATNVGKFTAWVYCLECKKTGKVVRKTWPVPIFLFLRILTCLLQNGGTSNMKDHLLRHHKDVFKEPATLDKFLHSSRMFRTFEAFSLSKF
jgi:hypothetical protein